MNKELFDRVNFLYNKNKTSLKHLRGRHDQRDHAWNRGMGRGGGGYAPGYMNQTQFLELKRSLQAQIAAGDISQEEGEALWTTVQRIRQEDYDRANPRTEDELSRRESSVETLANRRNRNRTAQQTTPAPTSSAFISDAASSVMLANQMTDYGSGFLSRLSGSQPFRPGFTQEQYEAFGVKTDGTNTDMGIKIRTSGARDSIGSSFNASFQRLGFMLERLKSSDPTRINDDGTGEQSNGDIMTERLSQILSNSGLTEFFYNAANESEYNSAEENFLDAVQIPLVQENLAKYNDILQNLKIEDLTDSLGEKEKAFFNQLLEAHRNYVSNMSIIFGADYIQSMIDFHQNTSTLDFNAVSNKGVPDRNLMQNWQADPQVVFDALAESSPENAAKLISSMMALSATDQNGFYPSDDFVDAAYSIILSYPSLKESLEQSLQLINERDNTSRNINDVSSLAKPAETWLYEVFDRIYDSTYKSSYEKINALKQTYPANSSQLAQSVSSVMTDMFNQIESVNVNNARQIIKKIIEDNFSTIDGASASLNEAFATISKSIFDSRLSPDVKKEAFDIIRKYMSTLRMSPGQLRDLTLSQAELWMQNLRNNGLEGTAQWNDATIAYDNAQWEIQTEGRYYSAYPNSSSRLIELDARLTDGTFTNESYRNQLIEERDALLRELDSNQLDDRNFRLQTSSTQTTYENQINQRISSHVAARNIFDSLLSDPNAHPRVLQYWREMCLESLQRDEYLEAIFEEEKVKKTQEEIWGGEVQSVVTKDTPITSENTTFSSDAYAFGQPINDPWVNNHLAPPDNPEENPLFNPRTARGQARTDLALKDTEPRELITDSDMMSQIKWSLRERGLPEEKIEKILSLINDSIIPGPRDAAAYQSSLIASEASIGKTSTPMSTKIYVNREYGATKITITYGNNTGSRDGSAPAYATNGNIEITIPSDKNFPMKMETNVAWTGIPPTMGPSGEEIDNPYVGSSQAFLMHAADGQRALAYEMETSAVKLRACAAWIGKKGKGEATGVTTWPTLGGTVSVPINNTVISALAEMGFSRGFIEQISAMGDSFPSYLFFLNAPPQFRSESGITKSTPRQLWQEFFYKALRLESMAVLLNPATPNDPGRLFNPFLPSKRSKEYIFKQIRTLLYRLKSYNV